MYYLAICAIIRDETQNLVEWITHHELQGVEHFYLYDDQSSDFPKELLKPWITRRVVTLRRAPSGTRRQRQAYEACIANNRSRCHWLAFLDVDEFMFQTDPSRTLAEALEDYERFPALGINWVCYGSSGFETRPTPLCMTSFQLRGETEFRTSERIFLKEGMSPGPLTNYLPYHSHIKSIIRASKVTSMLSPHSFTYVNDEPAVSPSGTPIPDLPLRAFSERVEIDRFRINHYWSRSLSEFRRKLARPRADIDAMNELKVALFREALMNQEYDPSILPHAKAVADRLGLPHEPGEERDWRRREAQYRALDIGKELPRLVDDWASGP